MQSPFLVLLLSVAVRAWDQEQLEVFDVVEEVNENFYTVLNISSDADSTAIRKAFRSLSLVLHPDKNDAPDADVQFRNLVSVYEVLRDPNKRKYYDEVLKSGLPNWKNPVYYYRRVRKMSLVEMSLIVFTLMTIGQYLIGWASYFEKRYTYEQLKSKRRRFDVEFDVPTPSVFRTLPFQLPLFIWNLFTVIIPLLVKEFIEYLKTKKEKLEEASVEQEEEIIVKKGPRRRHPGFIVEERDESELPPPPISKTAETDSEPPVTGGGLWTDDDLAELARLVNKFPGGTAERWEKISRAMCRPVGEVTFMAGRLKDTFLNKTSSIETEEVEPEAEPKKQKTKGGKLAGNDDKGEWTQVQQKALEAALAKHPKGPADRWDKIAKCVPDKTKEECILRYKKIAELVRKKREEQQT